MTSELAVSPPPPAALDLDTLYRALAGRLHRIVARDVQAPDALIEDACQFAWTRLLCHSAGVRRESVLAWLVRTAVHEALKLIRRRNRELSLEDDGVAPVALRCWDPGPEELVEQRLRLVELQRLEERQQRMVWLHGLGLSYIEIARHSGCTRRTVERQLLRAKALLRAQQEEG